MKGSLNSHSVVLSLYLDRALTEYAFSYRTVSDFINDQDSSCYQRFSSEQL